MGQNSTSRDYVVIYDGTCGVCSRLAGALARWDDGRRLEIVPSQSPDIAARFPWIPPSAFAESLQLVGPADKRWEGAAAVEELLKLLPRGVWIAWMFKIPQARPLANRFYRWFARNRYQMGCGAHCQRRPPASGSMP